MCRLTLISSPVMQANLGMLKDMGAGSGGNIEWSFVDLQLQTVVCVGPSNLVKGLPYLHSQPLPTPMVALEGIDDSREKATFTKGAGMSYSFHFGLESPVYMPYSSALPNRIGIPGLSTERLRHA